MEIPVTEPVHKMIPLLTESSASVRVEPVIEALEKPDTIVQVHEPPVEASV